MKWRDRFLSPVGLWFGAAAAVLCWYAQQWVVASSVPADCNNKGWLTPALYVVFALPLIVAALLSWRALRRVPRGTRYVYAERRSRFVGFLACGMPILFLLVMTWQAVAGLVYTGCER